MSTEIAKRSETAVSTLPSINESDIVRYLDMSGVTSRLTEGEKQLFIMKCVSEGLNPHKGDIYPVVYGNGDNRKVNMITAYQVFIRRAELTGKLEHWHVWTEGSKQTNDLVAKISIQRSDWNEPFEYEVDFSEFVGTSPLWNKMPKQMLKKCAIGNGFRLAFPEDCGGLYMEEEMQAEHVNVTVGGENTVKAEPKKKKSRSQQMIDQIRAETPHVPDDVDPFEDNDVEDGVISERPLIDVVLEAIENYTTEAEYLECAALAKKLTDPDQIALARDAFNKKAAKQ